jgi:hypothetical protein
VLGNEQKVPTEHGIGATVFDAETINRRVAELGNEICVYYEEGDLLLIGLLFDAEDFSSSQGRFLCGFVVWIRDGIERVGTIAVRAGRAREKQPCTTRRRHY